MKRLIKWVSGVAALLLVLGGGYYLRATREIPVRIAQPQSNVEVRVFGIGTVEAQVLSKVGFQVAEKVVSVAADQGDFVKAGALLAKLDEEAQRAKLIKSDVARRQAAASLTKVRAQRDRVLATYQQKKSVNQRRQTLAGRGAVSQEAAEDAQAAEAIALSDLKALPWSTPLAGFLLACIHTRKLTWVCHLCFDSAVAQPEDVVESIENHFVMRHDDDRGTLIDGNPAQQIHHDPRPLRSSSGAVGSSARIMRGRLASARAIATRCASPPESCAGIACLRWPTSR